MARLRAWSDGDSYYDGKDNVADVPLAAGHGVPALRLLLRRVLVFSGVGALHFACSMRQCKCGGGIGVGVGEGVKRSPDGGAGHSARVFPGNGL